VGEASRSYRGADVEGTPEGDERATKERAVGHGVPRGDVDLIPQSGAGMRVSPTGVGVLGTGGYHQERSDLLSAPLTEEMRGSPRQDPPPMGGLRLSPGAGGGIPGQVDFAVGGPDRAGVAVYGAPGPSREVREEPATRTEISALRSELTEFAGLMADAVEMWRAENAELRERLLALEARPRRRRRAAAAGPTEEEPAPGDEPPAAPGEDLFEEGRDDG